MDEEVSHGQRVMWIYEDLVELAMICAHEGHATARNRVAAEL